jgi:prepilin-type N-terminal cleavage/methylation domain-containing protein
MKTSQTHPWFSAGAGKGFSLLEILVTLGIVGMLSSLAMPAVSSMLSSREFSSQAHNVADLLKYAQAEARTKQSFVRVGFAPCVVDGAPAVKMAAFFAADGSGENVDTANMIPLSRVIVLRNTSLVEWEGLKEETRALQPDISPSSLGARRESPSFLAAKGDNFEHMITFTPRGEALLKGAVSPADGYDSVIDVSLRQSKGSASQDAAVLIDGATGVASVLRL